MEQGQKAASVVPKLITCDQNTSYRNTRRAKVRAEVHDFFTLLFTNWPSIVTAILGCYPVAQSASGGHGSGKPAGPFPSGSAPTPKLSSVHMLDSFTTHLILNCSEACIKNITTTIVDKINSSLANPENCTVNMIDINVHDIDLSTVTEATLPLVVGKRFLNSVVRVLAMEHSRVKNTFVEMQQMRNGRGGGREGRGGAGEGVGGEGRSVRGDGTRQGPLRNVVETAK